MNVRPTLIVAVMGTLLLNGVPAQEPPRKAEARDEVKVAPVQPAPGPANLRPTAAPITKPADPARVKATYEIDGKRVPITEGEFFQVYERLGKLEQRNAGRPLDANRVYEQILALAEARALGLEATDEEVALFDPLAKNPELAAPTWARYEKEGITKEMYAAYQKEARTIQKVKDLFANSMRILSNEVFEAYRRDHFSFRLEYVEFPASKYAEELKRTPPSDAELKAFFDDDKATQNRFRTQSTVSAEFVSFDPQATAPAAPDEREIPRAEALAYYNQNKARLDSLITQEQRNEIYPTSRVDLGQIKTPFRVLLPVIEREIRLSGKIRAAFEEAKKPGADFAKIAAASGLAYEKLEGIDREKMVSRYAKYGPQIFAVLNNHNPGDLSPELKIEPQLQFFYRLIAKEPSKLPAFEAVKSQIVDAYVESTSLKRAQAAAQAMRTWIDQKIDAEVKSEEETLLGAAQQAADAEIKTRGVTQKNEIDAITQRHKTRALAEIRQKKDALAAKYFDAYAKDNGLTVVDTGMFEVASQRRDPNAPQQDRVRMFMKTQPQIRTMEPGQVTSVLTDVTTKSQIIAKMAERAEPDYSKMSDGELLAIRSQTERAKSYQPVQRWQFGDISRRRDLKIE
jgi:hypothetical protein